MKPNFGSKSNFSTSEAATILHVSRIAILKKIYSGVLEAEKVGRNYVITRENLESYLGTKISSDQREEINKIVKKTVDKHRPTFRKLGRE